MPKYLLHEKDPTDPYIALARAVIKVALYDYAGRPPLFTYFCPDDHRKACWLQKFRRDAKEFISNGEFEFWCQVAGLDPDRLRLLLLNSISRLDFSLTAGGIDFIRCSKRRRANGDGRTLPVSQR